MELDVNGRRYRVKRIRYERGKLTCDAMRYKRDQWERVYEKGVIKLLANLGVKKLGDVKVPVILDEDLRLINADFVKVHRALKKQERGRRIELQE